MENEQKELLEKLATVEATLKSMKDADEVEKKSILNVSNEKDMNVEFKSFLDEVKTKTGVTLPIPVQFAQEIVPTVGNWGVKKYCNYVGRLDSTVLTITRSVSAGNAYWMSLTGGGTSTSVSATTVNVNMDCLVAKVPIYDYQTNTKGFNFINYVNSEINKSLPMAEDIQILTGTGSPFTGIYGDTGVNSISQTATGSIANLSITDLRNMISTIDGAFRTPDLKFYVDLSEEQILLGVVDANNRTTDVTTGVNKILGIEVVPVSNGVLNGATLTTTASKHFILANLKEAVDVADQGLKVEAIRTTHGQSDYYFYNYEAFGIRQPKAACVFKLHA